MRCSDNVNTNEECITYYNTYRAFKGKLLNKSDTINFVNALSQIISRESCIDAYLTRGDIYFGIDSLKLSKADFFKAIFLNKKNTYALYRLGVIYQYENIEDSAILFLEKSLATKTQNGVVADYQSINGTLATELDRYDIPHDEIIYQLALSNYYKRNLLKAIQWFNDCIYNKYRMSESLIYRGAIYYEMKKKDSACKDFSEALKLGNSDAHNYLDKYCK